MSCCLCGEVSRSQISLKKAEKAAVGGRKKTKQANLCKLNIFIVVKSGDNRTLEYGGSIKLRLLGR